MLQLQRGPGAHGVPHTVPQLPVRLMEQKGRCASNGAGSMRKRTGRGGSTRCHIQKARTHGCDSKVGEECAVYLGAMQDGYGTVVGPTWSILIIMENDG